MTTLTNPYSEIHALLDAQLNTVSGLPTLAIEDLRVQNDPNAAWARSVLISARTMAETIGINSAARYQGIYQIDIYYPSGQGWNVGGKMMMADSVIQAFNTGTQLNSSDVFLNISSSYLNPAISDLNSKYYRISISAEWFAIIAAVQN